MRLTAFIVLICCMHVSASVVSQTVSVSGKKIALVDVFAAIKKQTGYVIFCSKQTLENTRSVSLNVQDMPLEKFLVLVLKDQSIDYLMGDNTISLFRKKTVKDAISPESADLENLFASIKGRVSDEEGNPVQGISVIIKGSQKGTVTDANGSFIINGEIGQTIVISSVEFDTKEIVITGERVSSPINVRLTRSVTSLNEVMINKGYYTQSRITNVGGVSTLTSKEIEKQPVSNILEALVGRINGLEIFPKTGVVGVAPNMLIRGISSWGTIAGGNATNPPLFILDGVPLTPNMLISNAATPWKGAEGNYLNNLLGLNPADVESVSVLKDGDATAIYGSRGSNGVILITTKRGKGNKVKTNLTASTGFQKVPYFIDLLDNKQYRAMRREAFANDKIVPSALNAPDLLVWDSTKVHDWQKELIGGTATMNDISLSVSGGSGNTHFYVSSSYHDQGSVMPGNSKMTRASFNASLNYLSNNNKLSMDVQTSYGLSDLNLLPNDVMAAVFYAPNYPVFDSGGKLDWTGNAANPYAATKQKYSTPAKTYSGTVQFGYEVFRGLKLKARAGYNAVYTRVSWEQPLNSQNPATTSNVARLNLQNTDNSNWIVEPFAEYTRSFNKHHLNMVAGGTFNRQYQKGFTISANTFPSDRMVGDIAAASNVDRPTTSDLPYAYGSFYSRIGYDFDQKYLANFTFRRDGSTRFGPDNKFGNFAALGLGWVFSQEEFFRKALPIVSFGKLRASYGTSGNDNFPSFAYIPTYTASTAYNGTALLPSNIDNPNLKWEVTKKIETALEIGLLNNRISVTGVYFRNRTTDGLLYFVIAPLLPFNYFLANYPSVVQNAGWEVELSTNNIRGKFNWNTSLNLSRSRGKLIEFENLAKFSYANTYIIGESMALIRTPKTTGLNEKGEPVLTNTAAKDRAVSGTRDPFFGSMTNDFSYRNFNFSFLVQYSRQRATPTYIPPTSPGTLNYNTSIYALGRWQGKGDEASTIIPRFGSNLINYSSYNGADLNTVTANIFRIGNASLSYTLPSKIGRSLKMSRLQAFCNVQNVYVFDKYKKWRFDPSSGNSGLPPLRTIVFGINASF